MPYIGTYHRRLGQAYAGPGVICLDMEQNSVGCLDPNCRFGPCGSSQVTQITSGSLCLDENEQRIACNDPNCALGDCISGPSLPENQLPTVPRPSPTVPSTTTTSSPATTNTYPPRQAATIPTSPLQWLQQATLFAGIPNYVLVIGGMLAVSALAGASRRR